MLRSLMRRSKVGQSMRFPVIHGNNHWSAYHFHLQLLAAGPSVAVNKPLYRRWQRKDSMTRSVNWNPPSINDLIKGQEESYSAGINVFSQFLTDPTQKEIAKQALKQFHRLFVRQQQLRLGNNDSLTQIPPLNRGWYNTIPMEENLRDLLRKGEKGLLALEKQFSL